MATSIENFAIAGTVLEVLTTSIGFLVICIGPKAVKDYVIDLFTDMWRHSIFGAARYKWILCKMIKSSRNVGL